MKRITKDLYVKLTSSEHIARSRRMSDAIHERQHIEQQLKEAKAAHKEHDGRLEAEIVHLAKVVARGEEMRPVECEQRPNWQNGTIEIFRLDTGECVDFRAMTAAERQGELDLDGSDGH